MPGTSSSNVPPVLADKKFRMWWVLPDEELPSALTDILSSLKSTQSVLTLQRQWSNRLYGNQNPMSYYGLGLNRLLLPNPAQNNRLRLNVTKLVIDTVAAKVSKNRPRPLFLTSGAHYKERRAAQKRTQFVQGVMQANDFDRMAQDIFNAACREGSAFVTAYDDHGTIRLKRLLADEVWADEQQALIDEPRSLYAVRHIDREVLAADFPECSDVIMNAASISTQEMGAAILAPIADQIQVCEAWHLRSSPKSKDGVHVIAIGEKVLLKEDYPFSHFPLAHFRWSKRPWGYFGMSLAEELQPIQYEINRTCATIQESHMAGGSFKIWVKNGSGINTNTLDDEIATIIESDEPPQYITPQLVGEEVYNFLLTLKNDAFMAGHLSPQSVGGTNPLGPEASGQALREMEYIENDGFQIVAQNYERLYLDTAKLILGVARQMWEAGMDMEADAKSQTSYRIVKLSELGFQEGDVSDGANKYILECFPVSSLPNTPGARMETVTEWMQSGMISLRQGRRLMNFPDLDSIFKLQDAAEERLHDVLECIVDRGDYEPPDEYMDLQMAKELVVEYINLYSTHGLEENKLELLYTFDAQVSAMLARSMRVDQAMQLMAQMEQMQAKQAQTPPPAAPAGA